MFKEDIAAKMKPLVLAYQESGQTRKAFAFLVELAQWNTKTKTIACFDNSLPDFTRLFCKALAGGVCGQRG